jgi:hypothetical protein
MKKTSRNAALETTKKRERRLGRDISDALELFNGTNACLVGRGRDFQFT